MAAPLGLALKQAQHAFRTKLDAALRDLGLNAPQFAVLAAVAAEPGVSNAGLARAAFVTAQTMQGILSRLERAGLLSRAPHPRHGRVLETVLTQAGADLLAEASGRVQQVERSLAEAVGNEADFLSHLLSLVADRLRD